MIARRSPEHPVIRSVSFVLVLIAVSTPSLAQEAAKTAETWSVITIAGQRVGYSREWQTTREKNGQPIHVSSLEDVMSISRFQQKLEMRSYIEVEETPEGALLEFRFEMLTPPSAPTRMNGRVAGNKLVLQNEVGGKTQTVEKDWKPDYFGPNAEGRLLRDNPLKPGERRQFSMFDLVQGEVIKVKQSAAEQFTDETVFDRSKKSLLRVRTELTPQLIVDSYLDDKAVVWKDVTSVLGGIAKYRVARAEALKAVQGAELDLAAAMLIKVERIRNAAASRTAVYRIHVAGDDPTKLVATGPTQSIHPLASDFVELTVKSIAPPVEPTQAPEADEKYRNANRYLQTDDARLKELAAKAAGAETDPWKTAVTLETWVARNLKSKNFSTMFASAAEVGRTLSGDCTEHAVLLAALCRIRKVPSRIAVGLVYVDRYQAFVGHAWTEVFVRGEWVPLDATIGQGRVAADHIKFSDSALDGDGAAFLEFLPLITALGKMRISVVSVE